MRLSLLIAGVALLGLAGAAAGWFSGGAREPGCEPGVPGPPSAAAPAGGPAPALRGGAPEPATPAAPAAVRVRAPGPDLGARVKAVLAGPPEALEARALEALAGGDPAFALRLLQGLAGRRLTPALAAGLGDAARGAVKAGAAPGPFVEALLALGPPGPEVAGGLLDLLERADDPVARRIERGLSGELAREARAVVTRRAAALALAGSSEGRRTAAVRLLYRHGSAAHAALLRQVAEDAGAAEATRALAAWAAGELDARR